MAKSQKPAGRPRKEVNWKKAEQLASQFCTGEDIAAELGMSYDTLMLRLKERGFADFTEWYKKGNAKGRNSLRRKQFQIAMKGNVGMLIWLGKQHLDQQDRKDPLALTGDLTLDIKIGHEDEQDDDAGSDDETQPAAPDPAPDPDPAEQS